MLLRWLISKSCPPPLDPENQHQPFSCSRAPSFSFPPQPLSIHSRWGSQPYPSSESSSCPQLCAIPELGDFLYTHGEMGCISCGLVPEVEGHHPSLCQGRCRVFSMVASHTPQSSHHVFPDTIQSKVRGRDKGCQSCCMASTQPQWVSGYQLCMPWDDPCYCARGW